MSEQILGTEASTISRQAMKLWGYADDQYWDPLEKRSPNTVMFFRQDIVFKYEKAFVQIIQNKEPFVYFYGEVGCWKSNAMQLKTVFALESIVAGPLFDWVIYQSHEATVTFGGHWLIDEVCNMLSPEEVAQANQW